MTQHLKAPSWFGLALGALGALGALALWSGGGGPSTARAQTDSACTLPTADRAAGEARYREFLRGSDGRLAGMQLRVSLRGDTGALRRPVESAAAAEAECCAPLEIRFESTPTGGIMYLSADGEAAWTIVPMLDALRATAVD